MVFFNLVVSEHIDPALGLRIFHSTTIDTQYQKYKGILSHFHFTNQIPFLFLLLQQNNTFDTVNFSVKYLSNLTFCSKALIKSGNAMQSVKIDLKPPLQMKNPTPECLSLYFSSDLAPGQHYRKAGLQHSHSSSFCQCILLSHVFLTLGIISNSVHCSFSSLF